MRLEGSSGMGKETSERRDIGKKFMIMNRLSWIMKRGEFHQKEIYAHEQTGLFHG